MLVRLGLAALLLLTTATAARAGEVVLVDEPAALAVLERSGLSLAEQLGAAGTGNAELARAPRWAAVAATIERDIAELHRADPQSGVGVARFTHRLFDVRWLRARTARFELVGVVNRLDRQRLVAAGCGDTHLVYRLAYRSGAVASRLPMTVNLALRAPDDCREAARRWMVPDGATGEALAQALIADSGPLAPALRGAARLTMLQVNLQAVRWPSAVRPDLAAHAEYLLRTFRPDARGGLAPAGLDNTPDVPRLRRDRALRGELLAWIRDPANLARIDRAEALLPERFLTERAISVSPRGLARRANRPFLSLFTPRDLAGLDLAQLRFAGSPAALLRRLDDASCTGCHQGRSVAGFHFLGVDAPDTVAGNALFLAASPHLLAELPRRRAITADLARDATPDLARPFSERGPGDPGASGSHCGRGDAAFASWGCAAGLRCDVYDAPVDDDAVGVCVPEAPRVGDACEIGRVSASADAHADRIPRAAPRACGDDARCNRNAVGFPGGMCTASCAAPGAGGVCGAIAALRPFNDCLARKEPFPRCLAENGSPAGLRACDAATPCRDDYLCVRLESEPQRGACIPPYFVFQMRVDGHP